MDVDVVPGGCPSPDQVSPGVAPQNPAQQDIEIRDQLIANQEALLNVYRCRFGVDTQIVPGGCVDGTPAPAATPEVESTEPVAAPLVSAGRKHACATTTEQTVVCWGDNEFGQTDVPDVRFAAISAGWEHTCGTTVERTAVCWGDNRSGQTDAPAGQFTAVVAGGGHSCGLKASKTVVCWGNNFRGQAQPPNGQFTAVAAGGWHSCGLLADRTATCWGFDDEGQSTPPANQFTDISAGWKHTCGLLVDGAAVCWGLNDDGQSTPPAGEFTDISAEDFHTCGLRADGTAACWGQNNEGQIASPAGVFTDISAGWLNTCAIRADYSIACWGTNGSGQSDPPGGAGGFTAAELGCVGENPPCRIGADGLAYATRVVSHAELAAAGGFNVEINSYAPDVPDHDALDHLTGCLRSWGGFVPSSTELYQFTASPVLACNAVWRDTAYAVNHLGVSDVACVWDSFERLWLRGGSHHGVYAHSGWAGPPALPAPASGQTDRYWGRNPTPCRTWLDPVPDRGGAQACADLEWDHHDLLPIVRTMSASRLWEEYRVEGYITDGDGNLTDEWWKPTYCIWVAKCKDVIEQVAPGTYESTKSNSCAEYLSPLLVNMARRGRCGGLRLLAKIALEWAGDSALPHVAEIPGDQLSNC